MKLKMSWKLWLAIVLPAILLIATIVVRQMFDARSLGLKALEHIGQTNGLDVCKAEDFKLSLFRGLEIRNVELRGRQASGEWSGTIDRLLLEHRLGPLLDGVLQIDQISIEGPRFELVTRPATESGAPPPSPGPAPPTETASTETASTETASTETASTDADGDGSGLALSIQSIAIRDGNLRTHDVTLPDEDIEILGFDLELRDINVKPGVSPAIERLVASGEMRADSVRSGEVVASGAVGQLEMAAGQFRLVDFKLDLPQGELNTNIQADMTRDPFLYTIKLVGTPLHTHAFIGLQKPFGLGESQLVFEGNGAGPNPADFQGGGRLEIGDGLLPPLPFLVQIDQMLGGGSLVGAAYKAFPVDFNVKATRVLLDGLTINAGEYGLLLQGWADAEGPLGLQLSLLAPRQGLDFKELPKEMLDALDQGDGRVKIPFKVTGSSEAPEVGVDQAVLRGLAKGIVRQEAQKEVGKLLQGLFSKKDS